MVLFDEVGIMLDDIAAELPEDFYTQLNGGINLLPDVKIHPESNETNNLFILGEYHNELVMGKYINIYYGSFIRVYGHLHATRQRAELRRILLHEFTHHLEALAGERGLEIKDKQNLEKYKQNSKEKE